MSKAPKPKQQTAFNTRWPLYLLMLLFSLGGNVYLLSAENCSSWFLWLVGGVGLLLCCFDAIGFVFSKEGLTKVYFWGRRKTITWFYVTAVYDQHYPLWMDADGHMSCFEVRYKELYKGRVVMQESRLPRTRRIRQCLHTYYPGRVEGEKQPRQKKR